MELVLADDGAPFIVQLRRSLAGDDIAAGRLICPFGPSMPSTFVYTVISTEEIADVPKVRLFREWLLEEAASAYT